MKRILILAMSLFAMSSMAMAANCPKADEKAQIVAGNARFTVLTPQMIRMEWSEDGKFEDRATLTFVNRKLDVPQFKVKQSKSKLTITTSHVTLTYKKGAKFSAENLSAEILVAGKKVVWRYGDEDTQNLMGTTRTLDGYYGYNHPKNRKKRLSEMETGLLSRGGWTVVDDSKRHVFIPVESHWKEWVECRPEGDRLDLYLFAYGHEYTKALKDYTRVAGDIPLPPKYTFGYWWSRYWQYTDNELRDLVETMRSLDIPLDVLIIDMDWHETWGLRKGKDTKRDEYGQRVGWTGYTWKQQLFPSPENFLSWCHKQKLKTSLNLHPASGIQPYEEPYKRFTEAYGWKEEGKSVPYKMSEQKWADTYFETVLGPMENQGVDFWWLDWQQWVTSKYVKDLNNTFWLNHTFNHHMAEKGNERPMIYHRWGGLGSHRYQVGFSGDTYIGWPALQLLPWFTATASNVGYGYWGHDIGGHMFHKEDEKVIDPELYLRWLQYGVFTPVFKTHCTKDRVIERRIWHYPDLMHDMRAAMHLRYALVPYIYAAARQTFDTGVSMCRPMYYSHPEDEYAYSMKDQFMFGGDVMVAPIINPMDKTTGLATRKVWIPKGEKWYNMVSGKMYEGNGELIDIHCTQAENPYFAKAGAIIPMYPKSVRNLQQTLNSYVLTFIPGGDGETTIYEDDGKSKEYSTAYATTKVTKRTEGNKVVVTIAPRKGTYEGATATTTYELRMPANYPPKAVRVNGKELKYARYAEVGEWGYDGYSLAPYILLGEIDNAKGCTVEVEFAEGDLAVQDKLYGIQGIVNRCVVLTAEFKELYAKYYDPYPLLPDYYMNVSQAPNFITEFPQNIHENIENYYKSYKTCIDEIGKMEFFPENVRRRLIDQLSKQ